MADANLYVLEIRAGVILYLNERTPTKDGWWWGTDDEFVRGPFANYELAVADARLHHDTELDLLVWDKNNFGEQGEPSPAGNLIVINTEGRLWVRSSEPPVAGWSQILRWRFK
jgi:hypothetical protein